MTWVLHPGGEAQYYLSLVQVYDINTAQLWEPGSCKWHQENNSSAQVSQSQIQDTPPTTKPVTSTFNGQNSILPTQKVEPLLGFTPAEIRRAETELKLTVEQLLELDSSINYVKSPIQTLDSLYVHQP